MYTTTHIDAFASYLFSRLQQISFFWAEFILIKIWYAIEYFLADRTNGRAYATVLHLSLSSLSSVVVCNVMYCG